MIVPPNGSQSSPRAASKETHIHSESLIFQATLRRVARPSRARALRLDARAARGARQRDPPSFLALASSFFGPASGAITSSGAGGGGATGAAEGVSLGIGWRKPRSARRRSASV